MCRCHGCRAYFIVSVQWRNNRVCNTAERATSFSTLRTRLKLRLLAEISNRARFSPNSQGRLVYGTSVADSTERQRNFTDSCLEQGKLSNFVVSATSHRRTRSEDDNGPFSKRSVTSVSDLDADERWTEYERIAFSSEQLRRPSRRFSTEPFRAHAAYK